MKKFIASAGLVAVSSAGIQAAAPLSPMEAAKPWSISATLRGFYDDNNLTLPSSGGTEPDDSFGFEVRPAVGLNLFPSEQTYLGLAYIYSLRWFEDRDRNSGDHSHDFTLRADHRFTERFSVDLRDSFVYSQEPDATDPSTTGGRRTDADAFRNRFAVNFDARLTELVGLSLGYRNNWYDYDQEGAEIFATFVNPSRSGLLDRFEHYFRLEGKWELRENLTTLVGYELGLVDYTGDEPIARLPGPNALLGDGDDVFRVSEDRNNTSHHIYLGAEYSLTTQLSGSARVGVQYTDYDVGGSELSPWVDLAGTYTYLPGSYFQIGFRHARNATDIVDPSATEVVTDQETSSFFASVSHRITPRLTANIIGHYYRSTYNNGASEGEIDNTILLGLNLEYQVNPHWSTEVGYNFDRLDSDLPSRSYTRNRIYAGVRATY